MKRTEGGASVQFRCQADTYGMFLYAVLRYEFNTEEFSKMNSP